MEGSLTPTYSLNGGDAFGGGSGIWLFAILALMWGGFGGNRFGNQDCATKDDINFSRMESQVRANAELTERKTDQIVNGMSTIGYTMAEKFGETNALIIAENQKTRDLIQQNKIEALQGQINELKLAQAMAGVVRYPMQTNYSVPAPCFCGQGGI